MRRAYALIAVPLVVLPGCRMDERMTGAAGGAASGALVGAVAGVSAGTVVVLVGVGALAGYLIGDYMADQRCACEGETVPAPPSGGCCAVPACEVPGAPAHARVPPKRDTGASWNALVAYEQGRAAATAEEAEAAYEESIRLDPTRPEPWNALGLLALARGNRTLAREHLVRSLALDAAYAPALHNLDRLDRGL